MEVFRCPKSKTTRPRNDLRLGRARQMAPVPSKTTGQNLTSIPLSPILKMHDYLGCVCVTGRRDEARGRGT
eukprot:1808984-Prymnesium_polylepis.1